jgi:sirohydrochlorin cobaltochelatase
LTGENMTEKYTGVLLIGHGTREASGTAAFLEIAGYVRQMLPEMRVEMAFLEFARPTIGEAIGELARRGGSYIAAVPVFLSAFGHTLDDVPVAIAEAIRNVPDIRVHLKQHIGAHERVVELSAVRYLQALEGRRPIAAEETLLILAGHGSPEPEAILDLGEFAERRARLTPVGEVKACFAVLGKPQLGEVLSGPFQTQHKRIFVQPHLLLRGRFYDSICGLVEKSRREYPEVDWVVTEPLGPDRLLAQAVAEMIGEESDGPNLRSIR